MKLTEVAKKARELGERGRARRYAEERQPSGGCKLESFEGPDIGQWCVRCLTWYDRWGNPQNPIDPQYLLDAAASLDSDEDADG